MGSLYLWYLKANVYLIKISKEFLERLKNFFITDLFTLRIFARSLFRDTLVFCFDVWPGA